jgi:hypothetical protein
MYLKKGREAVVESKYIQISEYDPTYYYLAKPKEWFSSSIVDRSSLAVFQTPHKLAIL